MRPWLYFNHRYTPHDEAHSYLRVLVTQHTADCFHIRLAQFVLRISIPHFLPNHLFKTHEKREVSRQVFVI